METCPHCQTYSEGVVVASPILRLILCSWPGQRKRTLPSQGSEGLRNSLVCSIGDLVPGLLSRLSGWRRDKNSDDSTFLVKKDHRFAIHRLSKKGCANGET